MIIEIADDFDAGKIADSGQCFRWNSCLDNTKAENSCLDNTGTENICLDNTKAENTHIDNTGNHTYRIIARDRCLYLTVRGDGLYELDCTQDEYQEFWRGYLDLEENYKSIRSRIDPDGDPFLWEAAEHEKGIRILKQNPWEMLITFIISQNKNIPAIRRSVELLCEHCGEKKRDSRGLEYYGFPTAQALSELPEKELTECKLGYRCKYVKAAADAVLGKEIDLDGLLNADEDTTIAALTGLFGVGVKVANCVSLFGLHHIDAFPVDVWIKRILAEHYPGGYPYERYSPYNGIFQQYMFAYYRHLSAGTD